MISGEDRVSLTNGAAGKEIEEQFAKLQFPLRVLQNIN